MSYTSWTYVPFDTVINWAEKSRIKSGDGQSTGKYKMFVCSDTEIKRLDNYLINKEALIFGTGGKASIHYCNGPFAYSTDCVVAVTSNNSIIPKFLYYYFRQNNLNLLQRDFTGSGLQHTSKKKIGQVLVPLTNKHEQERIVARIEELFSELDKAVETLQKTKQQLAVYRQAVLKEAFNSISSKNTTTIQSVCEKIVDCPHSTPKWTNTGKLCLRTTNFKRNHLDLSEKNYVSADTFNQRNARLVPLPGDVLYSREGAILGIACIIPENLYVCLGQRMMLLRTKKGMYGKFLMYYLNSPVVTTFVSSKIGGSASPHVNVGDIKNFAIPAPEPKQQERLIGDIESRLSVCDSVEQTVDAALEQAEAIRQSILKKAFEGELA